MISGGSHTKKLHLYISLYSASSTSVAVVQSRGDERQDLYNKTKVFKRVTAPEKGYSWYGINTVFPEVDSITEF